MNKKMETSFIDISQSKNVADMVFSLGKSLETGLYSQKKIILDLGAMDLERPQILGLKSLVLGTGSELEMIQSSSPTTKLVALEMDIKVIDVKEIEEKAETKAEAIKEIISGSSDVVSGIISQNENIYSDLSASQESQDEHDELLDNLMSDIKDVTKELGERISDEVLSKISEEEIPPVSSVYPEISPVVYESPVAPKEQPTVSFSPLQEEFDAEIFKTEKVLEAKEITELKSCVSDATKTEEEPIEKEFIIDVKSQKNIAGDTAYIKQTLRSGQVVSFDGNVVIIGDCHNGSEIIASGDITVWGILEGIAHAGSKGNENAIIRALKIDALQLRIASYFARRPDRANIEFAEKTDTFVPEEARVQDGGIFIYTLNTENKI